MHLVLRTQIAIAINIVFVTFNCITVVHLYMHNDINDQFGHQFALTEMTVVRLMMTSCDQY